MIRADASAVQLMRNEVASAWPALGEGVLFMDGGSRMSIALATLAIVLSAGSTTQSPVEEVPWAAADLNDPAGTTGSNHNESLLIGVRAAQNAVGRGKARIGIALGLLVGAVVLGGGLVGDRYVDEAPWAAAGVNDPAGTGGTNHNESLLAS